MRQTLAASLQTAAGRWLPAVLAALVALTVAACNGDETASPPPNVLSEYLPEDWKPVTEGANVQGFQRVSIDGDDDDEWLYFFHYDGQGDSNGPIGGIVYDAQQGVTTQQPAAFFVPYRLLPDWRAGKGQGYLGERTVSWSTARVDPNGEAKSADELAVQGLSAGDVPTRLSLFRWLGAETGYEVAHFVGNAGLQLLPEGRADNALIGQVVTFNRLNDRSRLCQRVEHTRQGTGLEFAAAPPGIVFCPLTKDAKPGVPDQPTYPEAVVLAWLLGGQPDQLEMENAALKAQAPDNVLWVTDVLYPGESTLPPKDSPYVSETSVQTLLQTSAGQQMFQWNLLELKPDADEKTSRWRIASVQRIE